MSTQPAKDGARQVLTLEAQAQQVLDELWAEEKTPFPLRVGRLTREDNGYTLHFHDSRIFTACILHMEGKTFREMVRICVLDRVAQISKPR